MVVLASITLLVLDYRGSRLNSFRSLLSFAVYPLQSLASLPVDAYASLSGTVISYVELQKENRRLKELAGQQALIIDAQKKLAGISPRR